MRTSILVATLSAFALANGAIAAEVSPFSQSTKPEPYPLCTPNPNPPANRATRPLST